MDKAELESQLKKFNPNKSVAPDDIHPRVLKEVHAQLVLLLWRLFKKSIDAKMESCPNLVKTQSRKQDQSYQSLVNYFCF